MSTIEFTDLIIPVKRIVEAYIDQEYPKTLVLYLDYQVVHKVYHKTEEDCKEAFKTVKKALAETQG